MITEPRLKPCPFCGGAAKEFERFNANVITCRRCGIKVRQSEIGEGDAAERWNQRATPVAAQPDLTQQTLDDVMAGIPARDAEIAALRKEIETLRAQHDADTVDAERYRAWRDALITGKTAEDDFIRLVAENLPTSVGVSRRPTAAEWDAAIDAARKEQA